MSYQTAQNQNTKTPHITSQPPPTDLSSLREDNAAVLFKLNSFVTAAQGGYYDIVYFGTFLMESEKESENSEYQKYMFYAGFLSFVNLILDLLHFWEEDEGKSPLSCLCLFFGIFREKRER